MTVITSNRRPEEAVYRHVIPAGEPWLFEVKKGKPCACLISKAIRRLIPCFTTPTTRASATMRSARCVARGTLT